MTTIQSRIEFLSTFPKTETVLLAMQAQGSVSSGTLMTKAWISELREAFDEDRRLLLAELRSATKELLELAGIADDHGRLTWVFVPDRLYVTSAGGTDTQRFGVLLRQARYLIDDEHRKRVALEVRAARLASALQSIADSSCCGGCQEAALVAKSALSLLESDAC